MCPPLVRGISSPAKENRGVSPKLWKEKEPQAHGVRTIGRTTLPTASGITPRSLSSGKSPQSEGERTAQGGGFAERAGIRHLIGTKPRQGCLPTDQIPLNLHIAVSSLYARRTSASRHRPTKGPAKSERIHPPVPAARPSISRPVPVCLANEECPHFSAALAWPRACSFRALRTAR